MKHNLVLINARGKFGKYRYWWGNTGGVTGATGPIAPKVIIVSATGVSLPTGI